MTCTCNQTPELRTYTTYRPTQGGYVKQVKHRVQCKCGNRTRQYLDRNAAIGEWNKRFPNARAQAARRDWLGRRVG